MVCFKKLFPFCYRCTFLKRCDRLRSVPFYYRSPFHVIPVSVSFLLPLAFKRYRLASGFLVTYNTYVRTSYIHRRDSDKTYASCWLARVAVGSLVLRYLRRTAITRSRWLYTYHHRQGLKSGDIPRKLQQEGIKDRNGTDRFTPFLGNAVAVQRKRNGLFLEHFLDAYCR